MLYFDKELVRVLSIIRRSGDKGVAWKKLCQKFDRSVIWSLESLHKEGYTITKDSSSQWIINNDSFLHSDENYRSFITAKGSEFLEKRHPDFIKWIIPTIISTAALITSVLVAILK